MVPIRRPMERTTDFKRVSAMLCRLPDLRRLEERVLPDDRLLVERR